MVSGSTVWVFLGLNQSLECNKVVAITVNLCVTPILNINQILSVVNESGSVLFKS